MLKFEFIVCNIIKKDESAIFFNKVNVLFSVNKYYLS